MNKTTITLYGIPVDLRYEVHGPGKLEWHLDTDSEEMADQRLMLLEYYLRREDNKLITHILWDEHQARVYEADARAAAIADDYTPF